MTKTSFSVRVFNFVTQQKAKWRHQNFRLYLLHMRYRSQHYINITMYVNYITFFTISQSKCSCLFTGPLASQSARGSRLRPFVDRATQCKPTLLAKCFVWYNGVRLLYKHAECLCLQIWAYLNSAHSSGRNCKQLMNL